MKDSHANVAVSVKSEKTVHFTRDLAEHVVKSTLKINLFVKAVSNFEKHNFKTLAFAPMS